ncbi:DNA repair protein RadA [Acidithiobacillus sp.]|uniref:DNA repair protein RadA n=1 Tax=Acidithiobacillus sp. TaxID=1872118 RepID=UPI0023201EC2|nr:DNA repair protein RadA [Acidithiobacillus sp.]MDA8246138.1 DNA repair protein RadA [Acidithiobacillus sp.]
MSRDKTLFVCQECGSTSNKWLGRCPDCGAWNSFVEQRMEKTGAKSQTTYATASPPQFLHAVPIADVGRSTTGLAELDRVLGGGQVPGAAILLGGEPGIGKSTLLLQTAHHLAQASKVLYVTGEESAAQVALRAQRLGLSQSSVRVVAENHLEAIEGLLQSERSALVLVDSIQTVYTDTLQSAPGSVAQVRECAARLVRFAKATGTTVWLVGHVTKEGAIAGPRVLEHMVDTVLYFEGEAGSPYRIVRAIKNRFGAANELGVFQMHEEGLSEVANPSQLFLSQHDRPVAGSVVLATQEGTRPLLVEVQALVTPSPLANPRRVAIGLDPNRLSLLLAILHRHGGSVFFDQDVFVNIAGGIKVNEPAADLAVTLALLSSFRNKPLEGRRVVFGELGLVGEVRAVAGTEARVREAIKLGFKGAILPRGDKISSTATFKLRPAARLCDAITAAFDGG